MLTQAAAAPSTSITPTWHKASDAQVLLNLRGTNVNRVYAQLKRSSDDGKAFVAFMRAFCEPKDWLIPMGQPARGPLGVLTDTSIDAVPTKILFKSISPELLSRKFAREFLESVGFSYKVVDKIPVVDVELAVQFQVLFKGAISLPKTNGRIFIVGTGENIARKSGINNPALAGTILYLRSDTPKRHILMHFQELASALRKTLHQQRREDEEIKNLAQIKGDARNIVPKIESWHTLEQHGQKSVAREATTNASHASKVFPAPRGENKRHAVNGVKSAAGLKDARGRINPAGSKVRLNWAAKGLEVREEEVVKIGGHNREDNLAIRSLMDENFRLFSDVEGKLKDQLNPKRKGAVETVSKLEIFSNEKMAESTRIRQVVNFLTLVGLAEKNLGTIVARPYITFRDELEKQILVFNEAARAHDAERGVNSVRGMYVITRLAGLQEKLNLAREALVKGIGGVPEAAAQIERMGKDFEALKTDVGRPTGLYAESFRGFADAFKETKEALGLKNVPPEGDREKTKTYLDGLKTLFSSVDVEDRLLKSRK